MSPLNDKINEQCFVHIFRCPKQFSVVLKILYSSHRRLDWLPYSFGHPNVDFSAAIYFPAPNAIFGGVEYSPRSQADNYSRRLLYISRRKTPPSATLNIFLAANAAFGVAIRPKRRRVNYTINHGISHLAILSPLQSFVSKNGLGEPLIWTS